MSPYELLWLYPYVLVFNLGWACAYYWLSPMPWPANTLGWFIDVVLLLTPFPIFFFLVVGGRHIAKAWMKRTGRRTICPHGS